jgi:hypothetical protein
MHLKDQQMVCDAWEKALGTAPATATVPDERPMLKVTALQPDKFLFYSQIIHELCFFPTHSPTQLIREVATLELEIKHLEQHLLTLYRKTYNKHPHCPL